MAHLIQSDIAEQERERAASERALALSNYFIKSRDILELKNTAADIYKRRFVVKLKEETSENPHRFKMAKAVIDTIFGESRETPDEKSDKAPDEDEGQSSPTGPSGTVENKQSPSESPSEESSSAGNDASPGGGASKSAESGNLNKGNIQRYMARLLGEIRRISNCGGYQYYFL